MLYTSIADWFPANPSAHEMEIAGIILFSLGAGYTAYQLHKDRVSLNADRRSVWKRAEELLKMREEEQTKRMELNQGFDWKNNLPMILQFLAKRINIDPEDIDMDEVQNLLSNINMEDKNNGNLERKHTI